MNSYFLMNVWGTISIAMAALGMVVVPLSWIWRWSLAEKVGATIVVLGVASFLAALYVTWLLQTLRVIQ